MDSAELHQRRPPPSQAPSENDIPKYTVDLSVSPEHRYDHIVADFSQQARFLPHLFDGVIESIIPRQYVPLVISLAKLFLCRLYDSEETRELRGISRATGIDMYLLVAMNVLLDTFMGCTSGGVRVKDRNRDPKMLHFRSLDWGMDPLRKVVCQLDFVRRPGTPVVARSVTYFGYVAVLTGVRKGLSMSLNFRPHHDQSSRLKRVRFFWHCALVVLGFRRSIASVLRQYLLPANDASPPADLASDIAPLPSTAAYLIFCTGQQTMVIEKDNYSAQIYRANDLLYL